MPADQADGPPSSRSTEDMSLAGDPGPARRGFVRRHWGKLALATIVALPVLVVTIWTTIAFGYSYSSGERVGYVQKFSKKGWLCKTWEGELAQVNMPGSLAQIFPFTVRSDSIAAAINAAEGRRVAIKYEQHVGVPTSCFGETQYFVVGVRAVAN
jgi:hypothetical protein